MGCDYPRWFGHESAATPQPLSLFFSLMCFPQLMFVSIPNRPSILLRITVKLKDQNLWYVMFLAVCHGHIVPTSSCVAGVVPTNPGSVSLGWPVAVNVLQEVPEEILGPKMGNRF